MQGYGDLRALSAGRSPGELLLVVQRAPQGADGELLWVGAAGLPGGGGRELSSQTTNERGLIASVDLAPTILDHLGLRPIPPDMRGDPIRTDGELHSASLRALEARLRVIGGRRLEALGFLLVAWALLLLACSRRRPARAWAMRAGALGVMWAPIAVLIAGAFEPGRAVGIRDDHARLPVARRAHRPAAAMAASPAGSGRRRGGGDRRGRPRRTPSC